MNRCFTALVFCGALVVPAVAHADPGDLSDGVPSDDAAGAAPATSSNEVALDFIEDVSRMTNRETMLGVRLASVEGDWALAVEPRAGLTLPAAPGANVSAASVGVDVTMERRANVGAFTFILGGGAGADYIWQHAAGSDAPPAWSNHALAAGPVAVAGVRMRFTKDAWFELGARGGLDLANVDGSFGPVAMYGAGGAWGLTF